MAKYICPACEAELDKKYDICPSCGITLKEIDDEDLVLCPKCGWSYSAYDVACPYCSETLSEEEKEKQIDANKDKKELLKSKRNREVNKYVDVDVEENIDVLMRYASLVMNIYVFAAIISGLIGIVCLFIEYGFIYSILLFAATASFMFLSYIHPAFIRNRALILKKLYQLHLEQTKKKN